MNTFARTLKTRHALAIVLASSNLFFSAAALAQLQETRVQVKDAWARATVPGQQAGGAFMKITASEGLQLVGVSTPVAPVAEVHEMKMDGGVMRMRAVPILDLPAGSTVELKPGGHHIMLMDLKAPLQKDSQVTLTLVFKDIKGVQSRLDLSLPVVSNAPALR